MGAGHQVAFPIAWAVFHPGEAAEQKAKQPWKLQVVSTSPKASLSYKAEASCHNPGLPTTLPALGAAFVLGSPDPSSCCPKVDADGSAAKGARV